VSLTRDLVERLRAHPNSEWTDATLQARLSAHDAMLTALDRRQFGRAPCGTVKCRVASVNRRHCTV